MKDAHLQEARGILLSGALVACLLLVAGAPAKYLSVHAILHISAHFKPTPHFSPQCVFHQLGLVQRPSAGPTRARPEALRGGSATGPACLTFRQASCLCMAGSRAIGLGGRNRCGRQGMCGCSIPGVRAGIARQC